MGSPAAPPHRLDLTRTMVLFVSPGARQGSHHILSRLPRSQIERGRKGKEGLFGVDVLQLVLMTEISIWK